jgi:DNA-binding protein HU-beta
MLAKCVPIALDNALADYGGNVNKTELIDAISGDTGLTRKQAESAVDALVYEVTAGVFAGSPVRITGFGTFKLRERAARRGRNPQTGAAVRIKASRGIGFTPGLQLKADLNARRAPRRVELAGTTAKKAAPVKKAAAATNQDRRGEEGHSGEEGHRSPLGPSPRAVRSA